MHRCQHLSSSTTSCSWEEQKRVTVKTRKFLLINTILTHLISWKHIILTQQWWDRVREHSVRLPGWAELSRIWILRQATGQGQDWTTLDWSASCRVAVTLHTLSLGRRDRCRQVGCWLCILLGGVEASSSSSSSLLSSSWGSWKQTLFNSKTKDVSFLSAQFSVFVRMTQPFNVHTHNVEFYYLSCHHIVYILCLCHCECTQRILNWETTSSKIWDIQLFWAEKKR